MEIWLTSSLSGSCTDPDRHVSHDATMVWYFCLFLFTFFVVWEIIYVRRPSPQELLQTHISEWAIVLVSGGVASSKNENVA